MPCVLIALALSSCGGGGSASSSSSATEAVVVVTESSSSTTSTAAPTPSPSPTPAPSPTPSPTTSPTPSPTPSASTSSWSASGDPVNSVFVGNDPASLSSYENWLGRKTEGVQLHTGRENWDDWKGSIGWMAGQWASVDRTKFWTIPLIVKGGSLSAASSGSYDSYYVAGAQDLLAASPGSGPIFVRTGWEFNGNWQPWAAADKSGDYRGAFQKFVKAFRGVSDRFVFEWAPNIGDMGMNPEDAWPGDAYVDIVGLSIYANDSDPSDPAEAFQLMVDRNYGLQWQQDFAASHGKATAISEWAIKSDDAGIYVSLMADWIADHKMAYQSYWNSNADYPGMLSSQQYPGVSADYRSAVAKLD